MAVSKTIAIGMLAAETNTPSRTADPPDQFGHNREPGHHMRRRYTHEVEYRGKCFRTFKELCVTVLHKSKSDDQAQRNGSPSLKRQLFEHENSSLKCCTEDLSFCDERRLSSTPHCDHPPCQQGKIGSNYLRLREAIDWQWCVPRPHHKPRRTPNSLCTERVPSVCCDEA